MHQNHNKLSPHTFKNSYHQEDRDGMFWQEGKEKWTCVHSVGMQVDSATMENNTEIPQKIKQVYPMI